MKNYKFLFIAYVLIIKMSQACEKPTYVIGVANIDYTPHYNFSSSDNTSFFNNFVKWLSNKTGCEFVVKPMPIKRLYATYKRQSEIDFIYPDNPVWINPNDSDWQGHARIYSKPLAFTISGTMVLPKNINIDIRNFKVLAIPRGFTPAAWLPLKSIYNVKFHETFDAKTALLMVQSGRSDGADVEYNVALHIIKKHKLVQMSLAKTLPNIPTGFHMSTFSEPKMMKTINKLIESHHEEINTLKEIAKLKENPKLINNQALIGK